MQDRPTYQELIDAVRHFLEHDAVPTLEGTKKFHARVAANVLAIVGRELALRDGHLDREWARLDDLLGAEALPSRAEMAEALRTRTAALCERIRRGDADAEPFRGRVFAHVRQTVREKLAIDNPRLIGPA